MKQGDVNITNPIPHRKLDIILVDKSFDGEISWLQVHALAEVTHTELIKSRTIKDTVYQKSYIMFRSQDNRNFIPSLYFTREGFFTFNVCTLKVADHPLIPLHIIVGLIFGHPAMIGYDETIQCDAHGRARTIRVGRLNYLVRVELFKSSALHGWAMRCWSVKSTDERKEGFVVKDCWADARCEQSKLSVLKIIQELDLCESHGMPRLVHGENVSMLLNEKMKIYGNDCMA